MPPAAFSPRTHPQRTPEGTPPVRSSAAALLDGLFKHPVIVQATMALGAFWPFFAYTDFFCNLLGTHDGLSMVPLAAPQQDSLVP